MKNLRFINTTTAGKSESRCINNPIVTMSTTEKKKKKQVWIWTENKLVMTAAVERGWNTFIFTSLHRHLATDWSCKSFWILHGSKSLISRLFFMFKFKFIT